MKYFNSSNNLYKYLVPNVGTIVIVALMLLGYSVYAAPSAQTTVSTFPYQGTLTDASGNPVTDNVDMTFRIFDVSTGGTSLWTEAHTGANAVPVENGLFQLMLGSLVPIPNNVWSNSTLYLELQISTDTPLTPRELIGSVPHAIQADVALTVPDGAITQANAPFAVEHYGKTTSRQNSKVSTGTYVLTLNGGNAYELIDIDISDLEFSSTPTGFAQFVNNATANPLHLITANYDWDGSSATNARIRVARVDGQPLSSGHIRVDLILWSP